MPKTTAGITRLGNRTDGPISPLSSPGRGVQAAQDAIDVAARAIVKGRPSDLHEQTGLTTPCHPVAAHDGSIAQPAPRLAGNNRPAKSSSFPGNQREK
jgi:hypothetical protein